MQHYNTQQKSATLSPYAYTECHAECGYAWPHIQKSPFHGCSCTNVAFSKHASLAQERPQFGQISSDHHFTWGQFIVLGLSNLSPLPPLLPPPCCAICSCLCLSSMFFYTFFCHLCHHGLMQQTFLNKFQFGWHLIVLLCYFHPSLIFARKS
jgi:hypothetical protein